MGAKIEKRLIIFLKKDNCSYCKRMQQNINRLKSTIDRDFNLVELNIDTHKSIKNFARSIDVYLYPTLLFFNRDGEEIYRVVGYRKGEELENILNYISTNSYINTDLESFKSSLEFEES